MHPALLSLCEENHLWVDSHHKGTVMQSFDVFIDVNQNHFQNKLWSLCRSLEMPWCSCEVSAMRSHTGHLMHYRQPWGKGVPLARYHNKPTHGSMASSTTHFPCIPSYILKVWTTGHHVYHGIYTTSVFKSWTLLKIKIKFGCNLFIRSFHISPKTTWVAELHNLHAQRSIWVWAGPMRDDVTM